MKFDRTTCGIVEADILSALKSVEEKHGIKIKREGRGTFTSDSFTFKIKASVIGEGGEDAAEKTEFERSAVLFGFKPEHYGRVFTSRGEQFKLVGFNFRARRMPIKAVRVRDGQAFKFDEISKDMILRQVEAA